MFQALEVYHARAAVRCVPFFLVQRLHVRVRGEIEGDPRAGFVGIVMPAECSHSILPPPPPSPRLPSGMLNELLANRRGL